MTKVAIVGCGRFAENSHLGPYLKLADKVALVGFVDRDLERARMFAGRAGTGEVYRDISDLPGPGEIEFVDVCVPHRHHVPVGLALLDRGHNVLIEKPMALSTADCDRLIKAADGKGVRLGVGLHTRFDPCWVAMRTFVLAGGAGRAIYAAASFCSNLPAFNDGGGALAPWRASADGGGGALPDLGIYVADILAWTFGDPVLVQAMRSPRSPTDPPNGKRGSEMTALVTAELEGGVVVAMQATWDHPQAKLPPALSSDGIVCRVVCEDGVIVAPDRVLGHPVVFYPAGGGAPVYVEIPNVEPEIAQVVSAAEERREFPVTGREGRRSVAFVEAALDSIAARTGVAPR